MRKRWMKPAWSAAALLLVVGCSSTTIQPSPPQNAIFPTGKFTNGDWTLDFKGDGNYIASGPPGVETGTYMVTGDQVLITCECCGLVTGTYTWTYSGKALPFTAIEDKCSNRRGVLTSGPWMKNP